MSEPYPPAIAAPHTPVELYLDLMKRILTRSGFAETYRPILAPRGSRRAALYAPLVRVLAACGLVLARRAAVDPGRRAEGRDWPAQAETMIGRVRLDHLQRCLEDALGRDVPGDVLEAGVWRGGATIFMRAVLAAHGDPARIVWVADSFQGLPRPTPDRYPADAGDRHWMIPELVVPLEEVRAGFARYGLLDDRVRFLAGWFRDTLPTAPIERLAVLRLDGDMYESTMDALRWLYPKLSIGGYLIVDDYGAVPACQQAVEDYRLEHGVDEPIERVDWTGVCWQRRR
jgi:O-methyltransferase